MLRADISMWGEWLVYGTALGVGENVEKAMKSLNIRVNETGVPLGVVGMNYAFLPLIHFTPPSHGGSGAEGALAVAEVLVVEEDLVAVVLAGDNGQISPNLMNQTQLSIPFFEF